MICKTVTKRKRTRDEEEKEQPTKFTLEESVETFRKALVAKQDKEMMDAIWCRPYAKEFPKSMNHAGDNMCLCYE